MLKKLLRWLIIATTVMTASAVSAASCDDRFVDSANIVSDDMAVAKEARALGNAGADVVVRTTNSYMGAANLDEYVLAMQQQCPSWQSGGHRKSTMLIVAYNAKAHDIGVYYGVQLKAQLDPIWRTIAGNAIRPAIIAYANGEQDAYTRAFLRILSDFGDVLKAPVATVQTRTAPTTIVHQDASDTSWFGRMVVIVVGIGAVSIFVLYFLRIREDKMESKGVQSVTRRVRSACLSRLLDLTDKEKIEELSALADAVRPRLSAEDAATLIANIESLKDMVERALKAFNRFDNIDKNDPNVDGLPAAAYWHNQQAYEDINVQWIQPAEARLTAITQLIDSATKTRVA
ncbi:MAG: hypothetical protein AAB947_00485 [Patescibacteria group bacterium]